MDLYEQRTGPAETGGESLTCYDFGHRKDNFEACLPSGKTIADTGYLYQELVALGGWYYAPIPGSGRRRFYNRWYLNPSKDDVEFFNLGDETAFINLAATKFGKLTVKVKGSEDIDPAILQRWALYVEHRTHKVKNSWIVVVPENRSDRGILFHTKAEALIFIKTMSQKLTKYMREKYGLQLYAPGETEPELDIRGVFE